MTYRLQGDVIRALDAIEPADAESKDEIRLQLLRRKLDNLEAHYRSLRNAERRALSLISRADFMDLDPRIAFVEKNDAPLWTFCRHVLSSAPWTGRPGRSMSFWVWDKKTRGILGILELGSELLRMSLRDRRIGWDDEQKFRKFKLNRVVNVGTCVGSAPFGRVIGGKFQIMSVLSRDVQECWFRRYREPFFVATTTSLFGKSSIYNRLKEWEFLGVTKGMGTTLITDGTFKLLKRFLQTNRISMRGAGFAKTMENRTDVLIRVCSVLRYPIERITTNTPRGVYFASLHPDAIPYLRGEIDDPPDPDLRTQEDIADWWKDRWYRKRVPKVREDLDAFDVNQYRVSAQIETIRERIRAAEAGDGSPSGDHSGGSTPSRPLHH